MKKPRKPYMAEKPIPPKKRIMVDVRIYDQLHLRYLETSLMELRKLVPQGISDENIFVIEDRYDYKQSDVYLMYRQEQDNPHYDEQLKRYTADLGHWNKMKEKLKLKLATYEKEKSAYDKWFEESKEAKKAAEIAELKKKLAKLEKQGNI